MLAKRTRYRVLARTLWFVNPHYRVKFGLEPRELPGLLASVPVVRDFLTTTCYYLLRKER